jgi:glycerol kinase
VSKARKLILAIDQGTTGTRGLVVDRRGKVLGSAYSEFPQYYPWPGWVEHDAEEIWRVSLRVVRAALRGARVRPADLVAIGITNQRETTVVWNRRTGRPIHRAIVWQDRRTAKQCDELLRAGLNSQVRDLTGLVLDPYFSATKLQWLLDHVRGARDRAEAGDLLFGTIKKSRPSVSPPSHNIGAKCVVRRLEGSGYSGSHHWGLCEYGRTLIV